MADRVCVRGCTVPDMHWATCSHWDGDDTCKGCVGVKAREGALICERCDKRARRMLEDAADLVGSLRSKADPMKSTWNFDRQAGSSGSVDLPAPVAADLIDASNDIAQGMRAWALLVQFGEGHPWRAEHLEAGMTAEDAWDDVDGCTGVILEAFDRLANDAKLIVALCSFLCDAPGDQWTVSGALQKWPLDDRERWAVVPCPECDTKTVRIRPPRGAKRPARFRCTTCEWERTETDDGGLWRDVFADEVRAADVAPFDPDAKTGEPRAAAHEPRWLTLAAAARLVKRTPATVRGWALKGGIRMDAGRYWQDDVIAVRDERAR